jgi:hypothetical protein
MPLLDLASTRRLTYRELELCSRRIDPETIEVWIGALPNSAKAERHRVTAPTSKLSKLSLPVDAAWEAAIDFGRTLIDILMPPPVYRTFQQTLRGLGANEGLRVRLSLDEEMIDIQWEYLYRKEARGYSDIGGFLFLDPRISLVRGSARRASQLEPSDEAQQLLFLGTFWPGGEDKWQVKEEYYRLSDATRSVGTFLSMRFLDVVSPREVNKEIRNGAAIFHYSGHADTDKGRGYLVREADNQSEGMRWYSGDIASDLKRAKTKLVVLSACNSARWSVVKPLLDAGVPAVVGAHGFITSQSAIAFCEKLYGALAVGLSLDDAVTFARQYLLSGQSYYPCEWGQFMVYLPTTKAVLFPRPETRGTRTRQNVVRKERAQMIDTVRRSIRTTDSRESPLGWISEGVQHNVLLLGRFDEGRMQLLDALCKSLRTHKDAYVPIVFNFEKPNVRNLRESVLALALSARFVIAEVSDPRSVPLELDAIVTNLPSVPVAPIVNDNQKAFAMMPSPDDYRSVLPPFYYHDVKQLLKQIDAKVIRPVEAKFSRIHKVKAAAAG